jgi:hypothetical protein
VEALEKNANKATLTGLSVKNLFMIDAVQTQVGHKMTQMKLALKGAN